MGVIGLQAVLDRGAPLIDITITFRDEVDAAVATERINLTIDDFNLHAHPWHQQQQLRAGTATKEALERLFGWRLKRVPLPRYDEETGRWDHFPDSYLWAEVNTPDLARSEVGSFIESIGLSQPGQDDVGQWWE